MRYGAEFFWRPVTPWFVTPGLGLAYTEGGASFVFAELRKDFWIDPRWAVSISLGGGLFHEDGVLHLGDEIEFRTGLALSRRFGDQLRIGIGFVHVSNESRKFLLVSRRNPFDLKIGETVGGGVMLCADEIRVTGNIDASFTQCEPYLRLICHRCQGACVGTAMFSAAGAAIVSGFVRVVLTR